MTCPVCEEKTKTIDTAMVYGSVIRKRTCSGCGYVFYTEELEVPEEDMPKFRSLLNAKRQGRLGREKEEAEN